MRRFLWISVIAAGSLVVAVGLFYLLLPRETLQTRLGEILASWTGRDVTLRGEPKVEIFPRLTVTLHDVTIAGPEDMPDADLLHMDWMRGGIRFLPLLIGEVEIDSFKIKRPTLTLVKDGPDRNWLLDSSAAALQLAFAGDVSLGDFVVEDGTILFEDRVLGSTERIDEIGLALDWQSIRTPISLSGHGVWNGEAFRLEARAEEPFEFISDRPTPMSVTLDSAPLSGVFSGEATELGDPRFTGDLELSVPSTAALATWFGATAGPGAFLSEARLTGAARFDRDGLAMEGARLSVDGGSADGALQVTFGLRPRIEGTLAFDTIDLTPHFRGLTERWGETGDGWRSVPVDTGWLRGLDADLRLSADAVRLGAAGFRNTAATVSLADGRMEVGLAHAEMEGASIGGAFGVTDYRESGTSAAEAALRATEFALGAIAAETGLPVLVSGTATIVTDISSSGRTFGALVENMVGSAEVSVLDGTIRDPGLGAIAAGAPPGGGAGDLDFERMEARLAFGNGMAVLESSLLRTPDFSAELTGQIDLRDSGLALSGLVERTGEPGTPQTFAVGGTVSDPAVTAAGLQ